VRKNRSARGSSQLRPSVAASVPNCLSEVEREKAIAVPGSKSRDSIQSDWG
jgi:hypothetical protein